MAHSSYRVSIGNIIEKLQTKYSSGVEVWTSPRV